MFRVFGQGVVQGHAGFHFAAHFVHHDHQAFGAHAAAQHAQGLYNGHACPQHGRPLAGHDGQVFGFDGIRRRPPQALNLHLLQPLPAQLYTGQVGVQGLNLAALGMALTVAAGPSKDRCGASRRWGAHVLSRVAASTSSSEVMPCSTLRKPAMRKLLIPSLRA